MFTPSRALVFVSMTFGGAFIDAPSEENCNFICTSEIVRKLTPACQLMIFQSFVKYILLPTAREGNVFTDVCLFTGGGVLSKQETTQDKDPLWMEPPPPRGTDIY